MNDLGKTERNAIVDKTIATVERKHFEDMQLVAGGLLGGQSSQPAFADPQRCST